MTRPKHVENYK